MRKLELIDKIQIADLKFQAFILEDANQLLAFAIFVDEVIEPFVLFQQVKEAEVIEVKVNPEQVEYIKSRNIAHDPNAKENYRLMQDFVLNAENIAKESVFKNKKLDYQTDIKSIKSIKQAYYLNEE